MQSDKCFKCNQVGHWAQCCPSNSPNNKPFTPSPNHHFPNKIQCRCGHGSCDIKTANNSRNSGRRYYVCPIKRGVRCKDFVKWCDDHIDDSELQPPLFKYPVCECGAGVCRRVQGTPETPGDIKYYFVCPVRKPFICIIHLVLEGRLMNCGGEGWITGLDFLMIVKHVVMNKDHGSCGYRVSEDELLNCTSIVPSRQRSLDEFLEGCQNDEPDNDLGKECDLLVQNKRMRIMDDSKIPLSIAVSEIPEGEDGGSAIKAAGLEHVDFPEFEISDDDLEFTNSVPWEDIEAEAFVSSSLSTPSRIHNRQSVFEKDLDDASFGSCPTGWLGRLLFIHPTQTLKFPQSQPIFCYVFPSFNPIVVPKQENIPDGSLECNNLAINSLSQSTQLATGCYTEVSKVVVSPIKSPGSESKLMLKEQRQREVILFTQKRLLSDIETFDPHEHESMREAAEITFALLDRLAVDYKQFSEHIWNYINLASSIAEMDKSMKNSLTLEEHNKLFEEENMRLAHIQDHCVKTEALLEASNHHRQLLCEEVSHLKATLHEKQNQLKSCELEMMKIETDLGDMKRRKLEVDMILRDRAEQAEMARKQIEEKQAKQIAAKTALEKAKLELEN
ncbi:Zinc finger, CCHC-type [Sesbania bispinosa]|nr:Zinc finger, CCHC-type [Sesbania bispinosa]